MVVLFFTDPRRLGIAGVLKLPSPRSAPPSRRRLLALRPLAECDSSATQQPSSIIRVVLPRIQQQLRATTMPPRTGGGSQQPRGSPHNPHSQGSQHAAPGASVAAALDAVYGLLSGALGVDPALLQAELLNLQQAAAADVAPMPDAMPEEEELEEPDE